MTYPGNIFDDMIFDTMANNSNYRTITVTDTSSLANTSIWQTNNTGNTTGIYDNSAGHSGWHIGTGTINSGIFTSPTYPGALHVKGDADFEGDIKIKGKSLTESLEKIEEKLAILRPNEALEEKWENLRSLRKMYMDLEKEIIEQEKIYNILKK